MDLFSPKLWRGYGTVCNLAEALRSGAGDTHRHRVRVFPCSGRDGVKSLRPTHMGLHPQMQYSRVIRNAGIRLTPDIRPGLTVRPNDLICHVGIFTTWSTYSRTDGLRFEYESLSRKNSSLGLVNLEGWWYKGTSLIRKRTTLGPYRRPVPRVLGGS